MHGKEVKSFVKTSKHHVDEEQFGYISVPELVVILFEGRSDQCALARHDSPFFSRCLAGTDAPNELTQLNRHGVPKGQSLKRISEVEASSWPSASVSSFSMSEYLLAFKPEQH